MNRRSFFDTLVKGIGVFTILPPAETYSRIWKTMREPIGLYEIMTFDENMKPKYVPIDLQSLFKQLYVLKERRSKMQTSDMIEVWCRPEADLIFSV